MNASERDIFVVHTRTEARQLALYTAVSAWCERVGLSVVTYDDWDWAPPSEPVPDQLGQMPTDPWHYMPDLDTHTLQRWFRKCDVVLIVESGPQQAHSHGVTVELHELLRLVPSGPPFAIVVVASFGDEPSENVRGLGPSAFLRLSSPDDASVYPLIAASWLASRLRRSGSIGLGILESAGRRSYVLVDFMGYGPLWRELPVDGMAPFASVSDWWPRAAGLHAFMTSETVVGPFAEAWRALTEGIESSF